MNPGGYDSIPIVEMTKQIAKHSVIKTTNKKKKLLQIRVEKIYTPYWKLTALEKIDYWKVIIGVHPLSKTTLHQYHSRWREGEGWKKDSPNIELCHLFNYSPKLRYGIGSLHIKRQYIILWVIDLALPSVMRFIECFAAKLFVKFLCL